MVHFKEHSVSETFSICDKLLVFEEGRIKRMEYGLEEYLKRLKQPGPARAYNAKINNNAMSEAEEKMVLENRISIVLGKLSRLKPETPEYIALDAEFKELIAKRNKR